MGSQRTPSERVASAAQRSGFADFGLDQEANSPSATKDRSLLVTLIKVDTAARSSCTIGDPVFVQTKDERELEVVVQTERYLGTIPPQDRQEVIRRSLYAGQIETLGNHPSGVQVRLHSAS